MKKEKRRPFKEEPLRYPGQSLDDEIERLRDDIADKFFTPAMFLLLAFYAWAHWYFKTPASLSVVVILCLLALISCAWTAVRVYKMREKLRQLRLAADGERVVGQCLEELRAKGYRVLHDIVGEGFNIDHVVVGPKGIFTVETKTVSKPLKGETVISFNRDNLLINGMKPDRDPIIQAKAQASWIKQFLQSSLGRSFPVRPAVIYPGWYVKGTPDGSDVWVLNEKALASYIDHEPTVMSSDDLQAITFQITQYIRAR